jgi:PTH1 family peptidyl-tRNA hydrolase
MNESGRAVKDTLAHYEIAPGDALIVYDDLDLALGRIRLLASGGPGSHKGIGSVLTLLGTEDVPRLRVGIESVGRDAPGTDFVLARFTPEEWQTVVPALERAAEAIDLFRTLGIDAAMTRVNRKLDPL